MKNLLIIIFSAVSLSLIAKEKTMYVDSKRESCGANLCYRIKFKPKKKWTTIDNIENFRYSEGYSYKLLVNETKVNGKKHYKLVKSIEQNKENASTVTVTITEKSTDDINNSKWKINSVNGLKELKKQDALFIQFADNSINGNFGCNNFFGKCEIIDNKIKMGVIGSTKMYCFETDEQESQIFRILEKATHYKLIGDNLALLDDANTILISLSKK